MIDYNFRCGEPELRYFPVNIVSEITKQIIGTNNHKNLLGYSSPQGCFELRKVISQIIAPERGINCTPEEIMIVSGAQQAYTLIAEFQYEYLNYLSVVLENPGYSSIHKIVIRKKLKDNYLPVDEEGAVPIEKNIPYKSVIFLTPNNQFPTGATLTQKRRETFISIAKKKKAIIIEDDYLGLLNFTDKLPRPLYSQHNSMEVIYLGSLSKIFAPGFRLAFLIGNKKIINSLTQLRWQLDRHSPQIVELITAKMISNGTFSIYENKMRRVYSKRWITLCDEVYNQFNYKTTTIGGLF